MVLFRAATVLQQGCGYRYRISRELQSGGGNDQRAEDGAKTTAKSTLAAVSMPMVRIPSLWDLAGVDAASETERRTDLCPGGSTGIGPATGAMKRYPRRGTVSTYLGCPASSLSASRSRFTALLSDCSKSTNVSFPRSALAILRG